MHDAGGEVLPAAGRRGSPAMTESAIDVPRAFGRVRAAAWPAAFALLALATVALVLLGNGNVGAAIAPAALVAFLYVLWKIPLRHSLFLLMFLGLTLENPYEVFANGLVQTPLAPLGALLLANLNRTTGIYALNFTSLDVLIPYLYLVLFYRQVTHSTIDGPRMETARPMRLFALVSLLTNFALLGWGVVNGGDASQSLWQVHQVLVLPVLFFLCDAALRGPRDLGAMGKLLVGAGLVRATAAVVIRITVQPREVWRAHYAYATTHADSMLFVSAFAVVLASFIVRPDRKRLKVLLLVAVWLMAGMVANSRRLVWVELMGVAIAFYLFAWATPLMRAIRRRVVMFLPLIVLYVMAGWNSQSKLFAPVSAISSVTDSENSSTEWRDLENLNLIFTIGQHSLLGPGFGHQYLEAVPLPDISGSFQAYRYHPHNALLGLWAFTGLIGFSGMWVMLVVSVFLAARTFRRAADPPLRAAALVVVAIVIAYTNQVYGDMGLISWTGVFLVAPAMAIAGKIAVAGGAWPRGRPGLLASRPAMVGVEAGTPGAPA